MRLYRRSPDLLEALPTLRWLTRPIEDMEAVAAQAIPLLRKALGDEFSITVDDAMAQIGSGALPEEELPSKVIAIRHPSLSAEKIAARFRDADPPNPPILGRIHDGTFLLDLRGIFDTHDLVLKIGDSTSTNS